MNRIVMGEKRWYADAKSSLRDTRSLLLVVGPKRVARLREHLMAIRERRGKFRDLIYMFLELKFSVLYFRALVNHDLGVAARDVGDSIEIRMQAGICKDDVESGEWLVSVAARDIPRID
jgi:hypothetical protein